MLSTRALTGCQIFEVDSLPSDWDCVPLGTRIDLAYGRGLKEEDREPGHVNVYGSNGIVGSHNVPLLDGPGVLVGRKGTVGAVHYASGSFWPIDTVYYVLAKAGDNLRFLRHLLDYLPLKSLNAATGVPGLSRRDAYALRGAFPPLQEQAAIARVLDTVNTTIERTHDAIERAQALEQSTLEEAFDALVAQHHSLGEFAIDIRYGTSKASNDHGWGNPVLRIPNVVGDHLTLDDLAFVDLPSLDVERLRLWDGDLLLVRTNGNPRYVGRSVVFRNPDSSVWVYASYLIRVRLKRDLLPDFVNVYLGLERGRRELLRRVTTSAGNHNINSNSIRLLRIPVPASKESQTRIVDLAMKFRGLANSLRSKESALGVLKRALMHDLLTGRVRVSASMKKGTP